MHEVRRSKERGHADHGWLNSHHSFSFAGYHDARHMGFGPLRVINEDRVQAGMGFGTHAHRDMEIISYVLEGELAHKDSMGNGSVLRAGATQRMSAGTGVQHSEFNPSSDKAAHFLQIWIMPDVTGIAPEYEERYFTTDEKQGRFRIIASPDGRDGSMTIHQDAILAAALLNGDQRLSWPLQAGRLAYMHLVRGALKVNGERLQAGDALKLRAETEVLMDEGEDAELLLFDLPP